jgi:hypothetical protein
VLLLSNITRRNGGYQLLRAINDVRSKTELADPLLIVSESFRVPPFAQPPSARRGAVSASRAKASGSAV